ncbi:hypothetical protein HMPREF0262_02766 [Clostridium sp. ATCC 29733]|nr:hypothetical protein HMPREF0262_02766 [Clostridium sp. ATCC 29733]
MRGGYRWKREGDAFPFLLLIRGAARRRFRLAEGRGGKGAVGKVSRTGARGCCRLPLCGRKRRRGLPGGAGKKGKCSGRGGCGGLRAFLPGGLSGCRRGGVGG